MRFHIERAKASTAREGVHRVWKTRRWYEHEECSGTKCSKQDHARNAEHLSTERGALLRTARPPPRERWNAGFNSSTATSGLPKAGDKSPYSTVQPLCPILYSGNHFLAAIHLAASLRATPGALHQSPSNSRSNAPRSAGWR